MSDLSKFVKSTPSDPVREMAGEYKDDAAVIPEIDKLQESQMPKGPDPSPFSLGPMTSGGR